MRLVAAFSLAMMTLASAQSLPLPPMGGDRPTTIPLTNNSNGEKIGTVTVSGNRFYLRDLKGEHLGTVVIERDGTRTAYDTNGKIIRFER